MELEARKKYWKGRRQDKKKSYMVNIKTDIKHIEVDK